MSLVAECGGGGQEEGAGDHEGDEGKAEEEKRVAGEVTAVGGGDGVLVGGGAEFLGLEDGHCGWLIEECERSVTGEGGKSLTISPTRSDPPISGTASLDPPGCRALKRGRSLSTKPEIVRFLWAWHL